jgi:CTP-dependent riboflavin kinase
MIGPALHVPTREVWAFQPKRITPEVYSGKVTSGAGGASKAFEYKEKRRIKEFKYILGIECVPGSLNVILSEDFAWDTDYYRTRILDVADRSKGLDSEWHLRWARIYPISINGHQAFVFRFEGERYPKNMVEIISDIRLRDHVEEEVRIVKN